jgi:hypothetical protein
MTLLAIVEFDLTRLTMVSLRFFLGGETALTFVPL